MIARHQATGTTRQPSQTLKPSQSRGLRMPKKRLQAFLESLRNTINSLKLNPDKTQWADYYEENSYSPETFNTKRELVRRYLEAVPATTVWDLGANTGVFSQIACQLGSFTLAFDSDPMCVERAYLEGRRTKQPNFLPLRMDLTNPSPALGWAHGERQSFMERGPADVVMALALVHHLAISNNVPLPIVAQFFRQLGKLLIIEFVPKADPQVQRLLENRTDVFDNYNQNGFEQAFGRHFRLQESQPVGIDGRRLYLMHAR
jgi:ribosomal protein L11 methylase PrmA